MPRNTGPGLAQSWRTKLGRYLSIKARVAAGVKLLDELCPGWELHIVLPKLHLASPLYCVLGQLFGTYGGGRDYLEANPPEGYDLDGVSWGSRFGFLLLAHEASKYPYLTRAWKKAIREHE